MTELKAAIAAAAKKLYQVDIEPELSRPEEQFGDFSTNAALQLAKKLGQAPQEIAQQLADELNDPQIAKTEVAGPGFINFWLSDEALMGQLAAGPAKPLAGQEI